MDPGEVAVTRTASRIMPPSFDGGFSFFVQSAHAARGNPMSPTPWDLTEEEKEKLRETQHPHCELTEYKRHVAGNLVEHRIDLRHICGQEIDESTQEELPW